MQALDRYIGITVMALLLGGYPCRAGPVGADLTGTLIVAVQGLTSSDGKLRFVLFDSKKNFLKAPVRAGVIEINDQQGFWTVEELSYWTYAMLVHHDINASGRMERHWYGKPKEPTGASNDAPANFGPPKFKHAKFQLDSPTLKLTVTVK